MTHFRYPMALLGALVCGLAAPITLIPPARAQPATEVFTNLNDEALFRQFGGMEGLAALMVDFERELLANPTTAPFFANRDNTRTKAQLVDQICQILGGGCVYRGATMVDLHRNMGVNQAHFLQLVDALQRAMNGRGISFRAQNRLLAVLAPMHRDIITR